MEEPETQMYPYERYQDLPSSPRPNAPLDTDQHLSSSPRHELVSDSFLQDRVEETQYDALEPDTQATDSVVQQDSFGSRVAETQYVGLELDTQAVDMPVSFAAPPTSFTLPNPPLQLERESLLKRPDLPNLEDAGGGFKFGLARPRNQNPSKRPVAKAAPVADVPSTNALGDGQKVDESVPVTGTRRPIAEKAHMPRTSSVKSPVTPQPALSATVHQPIPHSIESDRIIGVYPAVATDLAPESESPLQLDRNSHEAEELHVETTDLTVKMPFDRTAHAEPGKPEEAKRHSRTASHTSEAETGGSVTNPPNVLQSKHKQRQRTLSRGRQKIKQPFPEATAPEESRRWGPKTTVKSDNADAQPARVIRSCTPSNTGRARLPGRDDDRIDQSNRNRQSSVSVLNGHRDDAAATDDIIVLTDDETIPVKRPHGQKSVRSSSHAVRELQEGGVCQIDTTTVGHTYRPTPKHGRVSQFLQANETPHQSSAPNLLQDARNPQSNMHKSYTEENIDQTEILSSNSALAQDGRDQDVLNHVASQQAQVLHNPQSRPQSRRSDRTKPTSRPLADHALAPVDQNIPRSSQSAKVKKAGKSGTQIAQQDLFALEALVQVRDQSHNSIQQMFRTQEEALLSSKAHVEEQEALITAQKKEIEEQAACIKAQEADLRKLREQMVADKATLAPKYNRILEQSKTYASHANEVVKAQRWLKNAAEAIDQRCAETRAEVLAVLAKTEEQTKKLEKALLTSEEIRMMAQNLETVSSEKRELIKVNSRLLADEQSLKEKSNALELELQQLKVTHATQSDAKIALEAQVAELTTNVNNATRHNAIIEQALNDRLKDLGTEKHNTEQLQKNLSAQTKIWSELVEVGKQIPANIVKILTIEDGALAKLLTSESTTQEKVEELTSVIKEYVKREQELPPTVVKLIQDTASRLEQEKQLSETNGASLKDAAISIGQELKENLDQLRLDKETEIRLNNKITELEHARENLTTLKTARDTEVDNLSRQLEESRRELLGCRSDLNNKTNELASALNAPREDPALRSKVSELEQAKAVLEQQVKNVRQEILKAKEEISSARKLASSKEEESRSLAEKLNDAQQTIKKSDENKAQALSLQGEAHTKICQDVIKNMESQRATMKLKLESEVKTLELRVQEKVGEIQNLNEQLESLQEAAQNNSNKDREDEMYQEQMVQLIAAWQHLQQASPVSQDSQSQDSQMFNGFTSVLDEIADLRAVFESVVPKSTQAIEAATKEQRAIEESVRVIDAAQRKKAFEEEQSSLAKTRPQQHVPVSTHLRVPSNQADVDDDMLLDDGTPRPKSRKASSMLKTSNQGEKHTAAVKLSVSDSMSITSASVVTPRDRPRGHQVPPRNSGVMAVPTPTRPTVRYSLPLHGIGSPRDLGQNAGPAAYNNVAQRFDHSSPLPNRQPTAETHSRMKSDSQGAKNNRDVNPARMAQNADTTKPVVHPGDETPGRRPQSVKSQNTAPTVLEESFSRRNSQLQPKSVLKKSTGVYNVSVPEPNAQQPPRGVVRATRSNSGKNLRPSQATRPLDSIRGLISGADPASQHSSQSTPSSSQFFDLQLPPMDAPTRNRKRAAPTNLESGKTKVSRRLTSSQTTIPETQ